MPFYCRPAITLHCRLVHCTAPGLNPLNGKQVPEFEFVPVSEKQLGQDKPKLAVEVRLIYLNYISIATKHLLDIYSTVYLRPHLVNLA